MSVQIKEVVTKSDMKKFVNLQFEIYKGNKFWAPPMKSDELHYLDPKANPAFKFSDAKFYIAIKDEKVVGRIGAIVNHRYNEKSGKKYVRFTKPEFTDDAEVVDALMNKVVEFGKQKGMEIVHGPLGFTNLDKQGLLVEGFEELQSIASVYHLPYYKEHFDRLGYEKENDWLEFQLKLDDEVMKKANRGSAMIQKRYGFEVMNFENVDDMKNNAHAVFDILNEAFDVLPYVVPFEKELEQYYVDKYFSVLNPKFVKAVKKDGELVGFMISVPSMSKAMQKANGSLFPFGIFALLKARKTNDLADLFLTGVLKKHQKAGVAVILFTEMQNALHANGISTFETTGVFESNNEVIANWKNYDHIQHKRRRCYVKNL